MSLFDELVMDALCGSAGRFTPGTPLEMQRIFASFRVPVPRCEQPTPFVHVAQVATNGDKPVFTTAWRDDPGPYIDRCNSLPTARVAT